MSEKRSVKIDKLKSAYLDFLYRRLTGSLGDGLRIGIFILEFLVIITVDLIAIITQS